MSCIKARKTHRSGDAALNYWRFGPAEPVVSRTVAVGVTVARAADLAISTVVGEDYFAARLFINRPIASDSRNLSLA